MSDDRQNHFVEVERDWCTEAGARALAARIEAYWRSRAPGSRVAARVERTPPALARREPVATVRSNLVGGLPPR